MKLSCLLLILLISINCLSQEVNSIKENETPSFKNKDIGSKGKNDNKNCRNLCQWFLGPMKGLMYQSLNDIPLYRDSIFLIHIPVDTLNGEGMNIKLINFHKKITLNGKTIEFDSIHEDHIETFYYKTKTKKKQVYKKVKISALTAVNDSIYAYKNEENKTLHFSINDIRFANLNECMLYRNEYIDTLLSIPYNGNEKIIKNEIEYVQTYQNEKRRFIRLDSLIIKKEKIYVLYKDSVIQKRIVQILPSRSYFHLKENSDNSCTVALVGRKYNIDSNRNIVYNSNEDKKVYLYKTSKLTDQQKRFSGGFFSSTLIIPFKIRGLESGDIHGFSLDPGICPFFGMKRGLGKTDNIFVNIGMFAGISSIQLDEDSLDPTFTDFSGKETKVAYTWGIGSTFEYEKFQFGLIFGKDHLYSTKYSSVWMPNHKWWFSIAIGIRFHDYSFQKN